MSEVTKRKPRKTQAQRAKGRKPITKGFTERMVAAFREEGQNYARVAAIMKCDSRTAKRGWTKGWEYLSCPPIKDLISSEQAHARTAVQNSWLGKASEERMDSKAKADYEELKAARGLAAKDAVESRKEEAQMVRLLRTDTIATIGSIARLLPGIQKWAKKANEQLLEADPKNVGEALSIIDKAAKVIERVAGAADKVMAMERRLLGQPEQLVGVVMPELSLDEALHHIGSSERTIARMVAAGMLPENYQDMSRAILDIEPEPSVPVGALGPPPDSQH